MCEREKTYVSRKKCSFFLSQTLAAAIKIKFHSFSAENDEEIRLDVYSLLPFPSGRICHSDGVDISVQSAPMDRSG